MVVEALGIRYARAVRFQPPEPVAWDGTIPTEGFGAACPQPPGEVFMASDQPTSEDCLNLNLWTPVRDDGGRPVLVWIHGGGFRQGAGSHFLSRGQVLAERGDVVVVTISYRLGALGFLGTTNNGLLDMIEALRWVRTNIGAFGGDPTNVTLFGESAGGAAVSLLCASPLAQGLCERAIVQSGAALVTSAERATDLAEELRAAVGDEDLATMPVDALVEAQVEVEARPGAMPFIPAVDGVVLTDDVRPSAPIPMIFGTNVDEVRLLGVNDPHRLDLDEERLARRLARRFGEAGPAVAAAVRDARLARGEPVTPSDLWFAIETERFFRVPTLRDADAHLEFGPTWTYLFEWRSPMLEGWLGACHVLEIPFVFGLQGTERLAPFTGSGPEADALSARMMAAWVAFARAGDPSTPELPWPGHELPSRPTMVFGPTSRVEHAPRAPEHTAVATAIP